MIYGDEFREERGLTLVSLSGSEGYDAPGLDHWGLVRDRRVREEIIRFLGEVPRAAVKRVSGRGGPGF